MRAAGKAKATVWRWRERFAGEGAPGSCGTGPAPWRARPSLPIKMGRAATMPHDYRRPTITSDPRLANGTPASFAALNGLDGSAIGQTRQRRRHREFIRFPNAIARRIPASKEIHAILDNDATHKHKPKHKKAGEWLARHPRWMFPSPRHPAPAEPVGGFFAKLTRRRLGYGLFRCVADRQAAIERFIGEHNGDPKPFIRKADPDAIAAAVNRGFQTLESNR